MNPGYKRSRHTSILCSKSFIFFFGVPQKTPAGFILVVWGSVEGAVMLLVLLQVHFVMEAVVTAAAAVRPVVSVFPAVSDEVGALAESLAADLTYMRFLPWCTKTERRSYCLDWN